MLTDQWFLDLTAKRASPARPFQAAQGDHRAGIERGARTVKSSSFRKTGRRLITNGSKTSRTGASPANSGGATRFLPGTTTTANLRGRRRRRSRALEPRQQATAGAAATRTKTCSTPGFRRRSWPFSTLGWPAKRQTSRTRRTGLPAQRRARDRLRHHLLLGRAHGHGDQYFTGKVPFRRRLHQRPSCATPKARRCRSPRATRSIRWNLIDGIELETLVKRITGLMNPKLPRKSKRAPARSIRTASRRSARTRCVSRSRRMATFGRTINFDLKRARDTRISATSCGMQRASC